MDRHVRKIVSHRLPTLEELNAGAGDWLDCCDAYTHKPTCRMAIANKGTSAKARFDAEKIEAGYKYLDSLRERMGVGQPAGEGGVQDPALRPEDMSNSELDAAMDYHRKQAARYSNEGAKIWRLRLRTSNPCEVDIKMENERLARRATQPATTPHVEILCACRTFDVGIARAFLDGCGFLHTTAGCPGERFDPATPPDVAERARRLATALLNEGWLGPPSHEPLMRLPDVADFVADIIAAEFK